MQKEGVEGLLITNYLIVVKTKGEEVPVNLFDVITPFVGKTVRISIEEQPGTTHPELTKLALAKAEWKPGMPCPVCGGDVTRGKEALYGPCDNPYFTYYCQKCLWAINWGKDQ